MRTETQYFVLYSDGSMSSGFHGKVWAEIMADLTKDFRYTGHSVAILKVSVTTLTNELTAA